MNTLEKAHRFEQMPDFGMDFEMGDFDINAAFQEAIEGTMSDTELALEEKVRRMAFIVNECRSEVYQDFLDFRQMAAQIEMMCNHDHAMKESIKANETLSSFMDRYKADDDHRENQESSHKHKDDDENEIDPKTGKKKKKKRRYGRYGWLFFST